MQHVYVNCLKCVELHFIVFYTVYNVLCYLYILVIKATYKMNSDEVKRTVMAITIQSTTSLTIKAGYTFFEVKVKYMLYSTTFDLQIKHVN